MFPGTMTTYFYQATDQTGKVIKGDVEATTFKSAVDKVRNLNYLPIKLTEDKPRPSITERVRIPGRKKRLSPSELLQFTQQLKTLVTSGLTLDRSLAITVQLTDSDSARKIFSDIQNRVHAGSTFGDALTAYPEVFSKLYTNMIRAGEVGGVLNTVLHRLAEYLEKTADMKSKVITSLIYPIILVVVGGGAVVFLMTYVVPMFSNIFSDMGDALPFMTAALLMVSAFVTDYWWMVALIIMAMVLGFVSFLKSDFGRLYWDSLILRIPLIGDLIKKIEVSRFSRTLSTLMNSGVPVLQALSIVHATITNKVISSGITKLHDGLKGGQGLAKPLQAIRIFPPLAVHMIVVGEETGSLEAMLLKVAETYDKEVDTALRRATGMIGPLLILLFGLVVILIVVSILLGMLSLNEIII